MDNRPAKGLINNLTPELAEDLLKNTSLQDLGNDVASFLSLVITGDLSLEEDRTKHLMWLQNKIETTDNPRLKEIFLLEQKRLETTTPVVHGQVLKDIWSELSSEQLLQIKNGLRHDYSRILYYISVTEDAQEVPLYSKDFYEDMEDELSDLLGVLGLSGEEKRLLEGSIRAGFKQNDDEDQAVFLSVSVHLSSPTEGRVSCRPDLVSKSSVKTTTSLQVSSDLLMRLMEHEGCTIYELIGIKKKEIDRLWGEENI